MADKVNGKVSNIEFEMMVDEVLRTAPYMIQVNNSQAKVLKKKFDSLVHEGFTEDQALKIICERPVFEVQ